MAAAPGARRTISPPPRSTRSPSTTNIPIGSTARSRTTPPSSCPACRSATARTSASARAAKPARSSPTKTIPQIVYGGCKGQFSRLNLNTSDEQRYWVGAESLYGNGGSDAHLPLPARLAHGSFALHDPHTVYYGSQFLHRTRDGGVTWQKISPDLTAHPRGHAGRERRADHARRHRRRSL